MQLVCPLNEVARIKKMIVHISISKTKYDRGDKFEINKTQEHTITELMLEDGFPAEKLEYGSK